MTDRAPLTRLQDSVDASTLARHLEWFSHVDRDTGGEGEDKAAAYLAGELEAAGVPVTVHEFDAFLSYPREASCRVEGPHAQEHRCVTHSFVRSTGPAGVTGRLVHVADGRFEAARDAIALVDGLATPVTILQASQAGCAGIVFANEDRFIHNMIGTTIWGTPDLTQVPRMPTVAAVSVDVESGRALKALLAGGAVTATVTTRLDTGWYRSKLPEVRIPGTREPERFVLAGGHYCAWHEGITDNATGDACLLEMAKLLWRERASLERSVRICWWPGHSHGRYSGSTWYADTFFTDLAEHGLAYYNIDSPGVKGATVYFCRNTCAEFEAYCRQVIQTVTGQAGAPAFRPARAADQSFLASGMPSFSAYPFLADGHLDKRPWTGGCGNAWWWHTEFDTLDKADVDILATDVKVGLEAVWGLANAPYLPLDYRATVREMIDTVTGFAAAAPQVDFAPLLDDARALLALLEAFEARRGSTDDGHAEAWNATAMRLGRILNPVMYTKGGRFQHDPAEWSPILRATKRFTMPGLNAADGLAALAGTRDRGFLETQLLREANRARTAVREAARDLRR
ncbi:MAG: M28 family peptidase [Vicinamibacterales bacterium]